MEDSEEVFFKSKLPFDEIKAAENTDSLLLKKNSVKLFMVKVNQDYAMYLGKAQSEVERLHYKLFKEPAERIINTTNRKHITLYDPDTKKTQSFYDIQERTKIYPCYCGLIESKVKASCLHG